MPVQMINKLVNGNGNYPTP